MTSEALARAMTTNPVVVRRLMGTLRDVGMVASERGHGGGWVIAADLETTSLRDVYDALGAPEPFAMGNRTESPGCIVEQAVNAALSDAFRDAEALLLERFAQVSLAQLARDFHHRAKTRKGAHHHAE